MGKGPMREMISSTMYLPIIGVVGALLAFLAVFSMLVRAGMDLIPAAFIALLAFAIALVVIFGGTMIVTRKKLVVRGFR